MTNNSTLAEKIAEIDRLFERDSAVALTDAGYQAFVRIRKIWPELKAAAAPAQEPDDDHPDCSTAREVELYDALMLLASLMLNKQQQLYRNGMQGSIRVAPVVSKALRLPLTGENEK